MLASPGGRADAWEGRAEAGDALASPGGESSSHTMVIYKSI